MGKRFIGEAAIGLVAILVVAGCGSGSSRPSPSPTAVSTGVTHNARLGRTQVLVDSKGFTLYAFSRDPKNTLKSSCNGSCASTWWPLILIGTHLIPGGSAMISQLGTIKRSDGSLQLAYAGFPLYTYALDKKPGDALGNGVKSFGGSWDALTPQGAPASR